MASRCCKSDSWEPKDINFIEVTHHEFPGKEWHELTLQQQVEVIRRGLVPDNWLIDPHCDYMKVWDILISISLLFTGVVTPYEVIFMGPLDWRDPLFIVERTVDVVFIKDMIMQFFLKAEVTADGKAGTVMLKDPWELRKRYIKSWFLIDFLSVLQFDIFFLLYSGSDSMLGLKFVRMARLMRLMKLLRMLRTSRLVLRWQSYSTVSFGVQKLAKFSFGLILASHWMACFWGLIGTSLGANMCDDNGNRLVMEEIPVSDVSWITTLFGGGKYSPDSPCDPWHVYSAALHWSVMTITSIGYGDIVPVRNEEYIVSVICMMVGGVVWANIIGGTCAIIAKGDPVQARFESNTDLLNAMMKDVGIPVSKHQFYREYLREAKASDTVGQFRGLAQRFSPLLKGELLMHSMNQWIGNVFYLRGLPNFFIMCLADSLASRFYSRKEHTNVSTSVLCIVERGTVARGGKIITPGQAFHIDFIVSDPKLRRAEDTISLTYCLIYILHRNKFFAIVDENPEVRRDIKRAAVRMALMRCIQMCASELRGQEQYGEEPPSLIETFSSIRGKEGVTPAAFAVDTMHIRMSEVHRTVPKKNDIGPSERATSLVKWQDQPKEETLIDLAHCVATMDAVPLPNRRPSILVERSSNCIDDGFDSYMGRRSSTDTLGIPRPPPKPYDDDQIRHEITTGVTGATGTSPGDLPTERRLDALEAALEASQRILSNAMDELRSLRNEIRDATTE